MPGSYCSLPCPGGGPGSDQAVYPGLFRDQWLNVRNYRSLAFSAMLILHLLLHRMHFLNIRKCLKPVRKIRGPVNRDYFFAEVQYTVSVNVDVGIRV